MKIPATIYNFPNSKSIDSFGAKPIRREKLYLFAFFLLCIALLSHFNVFSQGGTTPANITRIEYFIDTDPGLGNATSLIITPSADISNAVIPINPTVLTEGIHRVYVRARNANGNWGFSNSLLFYKPYGTPSNNISAPVSNVTRLEYFVDTDPGIGNATNVSITPGTDIANVVIPLNPNSLTEGIHRIYVRARNANGNWGFSNSLLFYKPYGTPSNNIVTPASNITRLEYYIDADPGLGNATGITISPGTDVANVVLPINPTGLTEGTHRIYIRARNANGSWGLTNSLLFYKPYNSLTGHIEQAASQITRLEYYFDMDPGIGNGTPVSFSPSTTLNNINVVAAINTLTLGSHKLYVRSRNAGGNWSLVNTLTFNVTAGATVQIGNISSPICAGNSFIIPLTVSQVIDTSNIFTAQLSDSLGNFSNPVTIGTLKKNALLDTITATIPSNTLPGTSYRIRVISSAISDTTSNTNNLTILATNPPVAVINVNDTNVCAGSTVMLSATGYRLGTNTSNTNSLGYSTPTTACQCPAGYVAVGYKGRTGSWMDQFSLACRKLNPNGTLDTAVIYTSSNGISTGGGEESPRLLTGNNVLTGLTVTGVGSYLSSISGLSSTVMTVGNNQNQYLSQPTIMGSNSTQLGQLRAPAGYVVTGMLTDNSATYSRSVALICTPLQRSTTTNRTLVWSTGQTTDTIHVTPTVQNAQYTLTVTSTSTCTLNQTAQGTVRLRLIYRSPQTIPVISLSGSLLSATAPAATDTVTGYAWYRNDTLLTNETSVTCNAIIDGFYKARYSNACGRGGYSNTIRVGGLPAQTISFSALPARTFGNAPFKLTATASSGLTVSYRIVSGPATVSNDTVTITGAGSVIIEASQPGDNVNFAAATPVTQTLTINKAAQTISFDSIPLKIYGDPDFTVSAISSTGLPVNITATAGNANVYSSNTIRITGAGTVILTASVSANANYLAATAQRSFCVKPKNPSSINGFSESCISTQRYYVDSVAGTTYHWTVTRVSGTGGFTLSSSTGGAVNIIWSSIGNYVISVRASSNCADSASGNVVTKNISVITTTVPANVTNLLPADSTFVNAGSFPMVLSFLPSGVSQLYDIYVWPSDMVQPTTPKFSNVSEISHLLYSYELTNFAPGKKYFWKVVAKNACNQSTGVTHFFQISQLPNLKLMSVSAPDTGYSGTSIDVTYQVKNISGTSTQSTRWSDAVYLSPTNGFNPVNIGSAANLTSLDSGQSYTNTIRCNLPYNAVGNYQLKVATGGGNSLAQSTRIEDTVSRSILMIMPPQPDLQVTSVAVPSEAFSQQNINISYTIKNRGASRVAANTRWKDYVYISSDSVFNVSTSIKIAEFFGPDPNNSGQIILNPDSSYTRTQAVSLPQGVFGNYYIFIYADAAPSTNVFEYSNELNNTKRSDLINIFQKPGADFVVTQLDMRSNQEASGQYITVNYSVKNIGGAKPDSIERRWLDGLYFSRDSVFNLNKAIRIGANIPLTDAFTYPSSNRINFTPYYSFYTYSNFQSFYDCANINTLTPNNGNLYTTPDGKICNADNSTISPNFTYPTLNPNESYLSTITGKIPDSLAGNYYLYLFTDINNSVLEIASNTNNTIRKSIQLVNPDLIVQHITVPDTVQAGENINISWNVKNNGLGNLSCTKRKDAVYLCPTATFNSNTAISLSELEYTGELNAGSSVIRQMNTTLRQSLVGNYYVFVTTDLNNNVFEGISESNNMSRSSNIIYIRPSAYADLQPYNVNMSADSVEFGQILRYTYQVKNAGTKDLISSTWNDEVSLLGTGGFNNAQSPVNQSRYLPVNGNYTIIDSFSLGGNLIKNISPRDSCYLSVTTDKNNVVFEQNFENNNTARSSRLNIKYPDLRVMTVSGQMTVNSGASATAQWTVTNIGSGRCGAQQGYWFDRLYLSTDSILSSNDVSVYVQAYTGTLAANQSYTQQITYNVPNGISGNYYLILSSDSSRTIGEKVISNNVQTIIGSNGRAMPVQINLTPAPDLTVSSFVAPASAYLGQPTKVKWTVKNNGPGSTTNGSWIDQLYLTSNINSSYGDYLLGSLAHSGNLSANQTYTDSLTFTIPIMNYLTGNYYIVIKTDYRNAVYEGALESNNIGYSTILLSKQSPADFSVSQVSTPVNCLIGDTVSIRWSTSNIGTNTAIGYATNGLYLSSDSIWSAEDKLLGNPEFIYYLPQNGIRTDSARVNVTGVKEGSYFGIVRADINNNIYEDEESNNAGISIQKINVGFNELRMNLLTTTTLRKKKELYYKLVIPDSLAGQTMMLSLYSDSIFTSNELYIRYGDVPTRADFDAQYTNPGRGNQDIILESLVAGTYYIMAYNDVANYNQTVKFLAKIIKFSILSVASNSGGNTGNVTVRINGAKFEPNMTATLFSSTLGTITASRISFINASTIYATFGLIGKSTGTYTVRLRKVNNDTANLTNGFSIVAGIAGSGQIGQTNNSGFYCTITGISADNSIDYGLIYPSTIRIQDAYAIQINFGNNGNVDIPIPSRLLIAENGAPLSYTPLYTVPQEINSNLFLEFKELNGPSDVLRPGATGSITVYSHGRRMVGFFEYFFKFKLVQ